ncbi:MAG: hypothetical protein ATN35_00115 [Epulopiscium sp. Nele67-Bin004]|nr:MAG: hypothetical protein ATN35_00115 [Epulopiscium sp. Nele67-Bin004]
MTGTIYDAPLFPGYNFNEFCLSGETPIVKNASYDWWINRPNGMNGWIINLTIDGTGQIWDDENTFLVNKGDLVVFPDSVPHLFGRNEKSSKWTHRWIYFHPLPQWIPMLDFSNSVNGVYIIRIKDNNIFQKINELFGEAIYLSYTHESNSLLTNLFLNIIEEILIRVQLIDTQNHKTLGISITDTDIIKTLQWLSLNYQKELSVTDIADAMDIGSQVLCKKFKEQMQIPLMRWINNHRLNMAAKLLLITKSPIKEIASQVGYTDNLYFSKLFKKKYGLSPKLYRDIH